MLPIFTSGKAECGSMLDAGRKVLHSLAQMTFVLDGHATSNRDALARSSLDSSIARRQQEMASQVSSRSP